MEEEEYTKREREWLEYIKRYWKLVVIPTFCIFFVGLVLPFRMCHVPNQLLGKDFHECIEALYLLSGWFYSWGALATFVAAVIGGIAAYQQLRLLNKNQKMQDALNLFSEIKKVERLRATRKLYEEFCTDRKFKLSIEDIEGIEHEGVQLRQIEYIIHTYEQMGAFAHEGIIDGKFVASLITGACVRMWIILEEYVQQERKRRYYPRLFVRFEYLAVLCILDILATPPKKIAIYHPKNSKLTRIYDETDLKPILNRAESDLTKLGLRIPSSSTYSSRPHYFTYTQSVHNGYKSVTSKSASEPPYTSETQQ
jgi:Domain of unknown function (DUF4760)